MYPTSSCYHYGSCPPGVSILPSTLPNTIPLGETMLPSSSMTGTLPSSLQSPVAGHMPCSIANPLSDSLENPYTNRMTNPFSSPLAASYMAPSNLATGGVPSQPTTTRPFMMNYSSPSTVPLRYTDQFSSSSPTVSTPISTLSGPSTPVGYTCDTNSLNNCYIGSPGANLQTRLCDNSVSPVYCSHVYPNSWQKSTVMHTSPSSTVLNEPNWSVYPPAAQSTTPFYYPNTVYQCKRSLSSSLKPRHNSCSSMRRSKNTPLKPRSRSTSVSSTSLTSRPSSTGSMSETSICTSSAGGTTGIGSLSPSVASSRSRSNSECSDIITVIFQYSICVNVCRLLLFPGYMLQVNMHFKILVRFLELFPFNKRHFTS